MNSRLLLLPLSLMIVSMNLNAESQWSVLLNNYSILNESTRNSCDPQQKKTVVIICPDKAEGFGEQYRDLTKVRGIGEFDFDKKKIQLAKRNFKQNMQKYRQLHDELKFIERLEKTSTHEAIDLRQYKSRIVAQINAIDNSTEHLRMEEIVITGGDLVQPRLQNSTSSVSKERR